MSHLIKYRSLKGYKYQLLMDYVHEPLVMPPPGFMLIAGWWLTYLPTQSAYPKGRLIIRKGYAWDGCSGPTVDTPSNMRASLVHDACYQLMREGTLPQEYRLQADKEFAAILKQDGMGAFRRWYYYLGVRTFSGYAAKPRIGAE